MALLAGARALSYGLPSGVAKAPRGAVLAKTAGSVRVAANGARVADVARNGRLSRGTSTTGSLASLAKGGLAGAAILAVSIGFSFEGRVILATRAGHTGNAGAASRPRGAVKTLWTYCP